MRSASSTFATVLEGANLKRRTLFELSLTDPPAVVVTICLLIMEDVSSRVGYSFITTGELDDTVLCGGSSSVRFPPIVAFLKGEPSLDKQIT